MGRNKSAVGSIAVWGGVVAILAGAAQIVGYSVTPDDQAKIVEFINSGVTLYAGIASLISGAVAVWGRIRASKQITGIVKAN
jgi:hypothetical protein